MTIADVAVIATTAAVAAETKVCQAKLENKPSVVSKSMLCLMQGDNCIKILLLRPAKKLVLYS